MRRRATLVLPLLLACALAHAQDTAAGKAKAAATCAMCHGPLGIAVAPDAPNLAGQPAGYLQEQLKAFRSGARKQEVMSVMARQLTNADIDDLAAWFSSVKVTAAAP